MSRPVSMSVESAVLKGASWLGFFKVISQLFSWAVTVMVARILVPGDYGVMEMATLLTSYAFFFSELGLGAAIIQRPKLTQAELSSIFWFGLGVSLLFAVSCFFLAYPTAAIFNEPRVIPLTKAVSVLFVVSGLQLVPLNLLKKDLRFKDVGRIQMIGVVVSCMSMLLIAHMGGGVWTLIGGHIIRAVTNLVQFAVKTNWTPDLHFRLSEVRSYLSFGISVAIARSLFFLYSKSDRIFAGRAFAATVLGYYSYALQLAEIPTEKIVVLINQVSFSAFSHLQDDAPQFNRLYLNMVRTTATIVLPMFLGGFMVGQDLIRLLFNPKWYPMIPLFEYLCLAQIVTALNAINSFVHTARGRPEFALRFNAVMALFLPLSFYLAVQHGINAIVIPWFTTYFIICGGWLLFTLRSISISVRLYGRVLWAPAVATLAMCLVISLSKVPLARLTSTSPSIVALITEILAGAAVYLVALRHLDPGIFAIAKAIIRR
jgi:O-antigen/teichoic acid export membrane protein